MYIYKSTEVCTYVLEFRFISRAAALRVSSYSPPVLVLSCYFARLPFPSVPLQTFKFEEVQTLRFEVYDVDTSYTTADAKKIDPAKQVTAQIMQQILVREPYSVPFSSASPCYFSSRPPLPLYPSFYQIFTGLLRAFRPWQVCCLPRFFV